MRIERAADFGRVAVVMGGDSAERDVSLDGGAQVIDVLRGQDINVLPVDGIPALLEHVRAGNVDRVFNLLHGRGGEDGVLQGALDCLGVPYTGSGVLGSALSMHKGLTKRVWLQAGLPSAPFHQLAQGDDPGPAAESLGLPLVVKPVSEGSSVGIGIVHQVEELDAAVAEARRHEEHVLLERFIPGDEYTVGMLQGQALPVVRIKPARPFYDYAAKYQDDATQYFCPSGLSDSDESRLKEIAAQAFAILGCSGWGRIDFIRTGEGEVFLLEANTTPGMTSHSLVPKAAAAAGIDFARLCWRILETSFEEGAR